MIQVTPYIYRGPRPTKDFLVTGFKTSLDLERREDLPNRFENEIYYPLSGNLFTPPSRDQLVWCLNTILNKDYWPIYVHCHQGVDRTGVVIAYYRVHAEAWTVEAAIREMLDNGFHCRRYCYWLMKLPTILASNS